MQIVERFWISGRGLVVCVNEMTGLPGGHKLTAIISRPDGSKVKAVAYKECPLIRNPPPVEMEAFNLPELTKVDVPEGSELLVTL